MSLSANEPRRASLDGAPLRSAEQLRSELATLVFTPDRLVIVKGGPAARRAYIDRSLARLYPARAHIAIDYATAVGQRNAALRRVALGLSDRDVLCAVDGPGRRPRHDPDGVQGRRDRAPPTRLRRSCRGARSRGRVARLRRGAPDDHDARGSARARHRARHDGRGTPSGRDRGSLRRHETSAPSARRASSASPFSPCFSPRPS